MKFCLLIFLSIITNQVFGQSAVVKYDKVVLRYIYSSWVGIENTNYDSSEFTDNQILKQIKEFREVLSVKNDSIASNKYLAKPSDNTLVANYLINSLKINRINPYLKPKTPKEVIHNSIINLPGRYELLSIYYNNIFSHLLNN